MEAMKRQEALDRVLKASKPQTQRILTVARAMADHLNSSRQLNPAPEHIRELCEARRIELEAHR
jgi:hypothetical protein